MRVGFAVLLALFAAPALAEDVEDTSTTGRVFGLEYNFDVGVGRVNITPTDEVTLAGSPSPKKTSTVETQLFIKALVIVAGEQRVAIVTLDTLEYSTDLAVEAIRRIEVSIGIPFDNIIICASHTHSGPLFSYYPDKLVTSIVRAVSFAMKDLTPCKLGTSKGTVEGVSENRRVLIDGEAWNRWQLKPSQHTAYPAEGPADPEVNVLAAITKDGNYKVLLYSFACHAANTRSALISADYPGHVQDAVQKRLGYEVPTMFLTGACGNVNPNYSKQKDEFGDALGAEIVTSLGHIKPIETPVIRAAISEIRMPGREHPEFHENEVLRKWPGQLEHYRKVFNEMNAHKKPDYRFLMHGIRIGDDFAIVTNSVELFCEIGLSIKEQSPFENTIVSTLTNGSSGYVPTLHAFEAGGYEAWFGEHSFLTTDAASRIEAESLRILQHLKE